MTYLEPEGVTLEDGQRLRHDEYWLVLDDGRVRELRLRVGRGIVRDTRAQADGGQELPGDAAGDSANVVTEIFPTSDVGLRASTREVIVGGPPVSEAGF